MKQLKHTWGNFKSLVKTLSVEQKKELLNDLRNELIVSKTRKHTEPDFHKCRMLRKKIAYMKTILNYKGFSYHPRG